MVETPWDGDSSGEGDRNLIPRVELRGAARHGHDSSCRATDLAGADVRIFEYAEFKRRLVPTYPEGLARVLGIAENEIAARKREAAVRAEANPPCLSPEDGLYLGPTPTLPVPIPPGSYLLLIEKAGFARLRCPVLIHREEKAERTITLYAPGDCPTGLVVVPAGEFTYGETEAGHELETRRIGDFFIGVNPVTCAEYLEFLNDLAATDPAQAKSRAPRAAEQVGHYWEPDENGVFRMPSPGDRRLAAGGRQRDWRPDQPVTCVSWHDALAYCRWKSGKDGRVYLLPTEEQREKAARGVDSRSFPFGRYCDPTFCNVRDSFPDGSRMVGVGEFPLDESPYGAMGMAGNTREWCLNDGGRRWRNWRALRGGSCDQSTWHSHAGRRFGNQPNGVNWIHGFRLMSPCGSGAD
ncbi:MAG: SUMF1/EgtB/PvdO family nonheme iron enzyme [Planctomycetota bacterium]|nr:SUMF1/EgtB/PvdO family nonheme iron enzyme [Planctomycetota bacterium]